MIKHINELKFEGETPWVKAMNEASDYWTKSNDMSLSELERKEAFENWYEIRYMIETGYYGNNS